jgi:hypothetical protein
VALEDLNRVEGPALGEQLLGDTSRWTDEVPALAKASGVIAACLAGALAWGTIGVAEDAWLVEYYPNNALADRWTRQARWDRPGFASYEWLSGDLVDREDFSLRLHGCLRIRAAGKFAFRVSADDGARLYVDDRLVADVGKQRTAKPQPIDLAEGKHRLTVEYFNSAGVALLNVEMAQVLVHEFRALEGRAEGLVNWEECETP